MPEEPLTAFYRQYPGTARLVLAEHVPDEQGRTCIKCSGVRAVPYPCALRFHAEEALQRSKKRPQSP